MKYIIIPYIALGLVLSLSIGIEYTCVGDGASPKFYGSPVVFKAKSVVSSMEYYYSILGIIINTLIWSTLLVFVRFVILKLMEKTGQNKITKTIYKTSVVVLIAFTTLNMAIDCMVMGNGFSESSNYWYFDMDKTEADWVMTCDGEVLYFKR